MPILAGREARPDIRETAARRSTICWAMEEIRWSRPIKCDRTSSGDLQHQFASTRSSRAGTGFGAMVAAGKGLLVTSEIASLVAAMSARIGATFIAFNRARTSGVRPGKDA